MTKKFFTILLILVSFFSFSSKIDSLLTPVIIDSYNKSFIFNEYTTVYENSNDLNLTELLNLIKNNKIFPVSNNPTKGINKNYYWVFFKIKTNKNIVIRNTTTNIDKAYLFNINNPNDTLVKLGSALKYSEKSINTEQVIFPINKNNKETIYVIKIIKLYDSLSFPLTVYSTDEYNSMIEVKSMLYVVFFTIMFLLNMTSIIFGISLRKKIFFYYSFYSLMVIIIYGTFKNIFSAYLYPEMPTINFYMKNISMMLVVSFNLFSLKFLNIAKYSTKIANVFKLMNVISLTFMLASIFTAYNYRYYIFSLFYIVFIVYLIYILIAVYILHKKRAENTLIFFIAFLPIVLATLSTVLISFRILPSYLLSYDFPIYGTLAEFLVFIIAILFEIKKLNDQRNILIEETSDNERKLLMAFADGSDYASSYTSIELHDNIGSQLALLKHKLGSDEYNSITSDIDKIKDDMLNISKSIYNKNVKIGGLKQGLINFVNMFNKRSLVKVDIKINNFTDINGDKSLQVLRIIQEAITNALKYSVAEEIIIYLKNNTIIIKDNGVGFDINYAMNKTSNGLKNMKVRAGSINAELIIKSKKGEGTEIKIIF